ncbi:hypothetical protein WJX74_007674 [Apatococcus lobatus]|uniref:Anaphase-promoting complex subunit 4 WD40 domain-containing protein n=1 Tax=Apatococcus lobatus TaxID=904363 RepID=A0AAW1QLF6_9CHLO
MEQSLQSWTTRELGKDPQDRSRLQPSKCHKRKITAVAWSPNGKRLASGCDGSTKNDPAQLIVWTLEQKGHGQESATMQMPDLHHARIAALAWDPSGSRRLAVIDQKQTLKMLDTRSGDKQQRVQLPGPNLRMAWSDQQGIIAVCSRANAVSFVSAASMKLLKTHPFDSSSPINEVNDVRWADGGSLLLTARGNGSVEVYSYPEMHRVNELQAHVGPVLSMSITPNERYLATAGDDACISVWDLQSLCCIRVLSGVDTPVPSVALSRDGQHLALALDDSNVAIYDVFTGQIEVQRECAQEASAIKAGEAETYFPHVVAWNPQHSMLAYRGPYYDLSDQQQARHLEREGGRNRHGPMSGFYPYGAHQPPPPATLRIVPYGLVTLFSAPSQ